MKNKYWSFAITLVFCIALQGCSFPTSYLLRNFTNENIVVTFSKFNPKPQIKSAAKIIRRNSKGLQAIKEKVGLSETDFSYSFGMPPESSAGISWLFDRQNNMLPDQITISKNGKVLFQFNNRGDAFAKFKRKSPGLFNSGGLIYYLDIK